MLNKENVSSWFTDHVMPNGSVEVGAHILDDDKITKPEKFMIEAIPRCYISVADLEAQINNITGLSVPEISQNKLSDPGSVMAGNFGEILTLFYLGRERQEVVKKIRKWRFKKR